MDNKIGEKISYLRKKNNLSQKDLAEKMNVSSQLISKWETGVSLPSVDFIIKLSEVFNVDVNEILGTKSPEKSNQEAQENSLKNQQANQQKEDIKQKKVLTEKQIQFRRKALVITFFSNIALFLIAGIVVLSIFVFAPAVNKGNYIKEIENLANAYTIYHPEAENPIEGEGYFNIAVKAYNNDDCVNWQEYEGLYENQKISFQHISRPHNDDDEILKNLIFENIKYNIYAETKVKYENSQIQSAESLFEVMMSGVIEDELDFSPEDISYIRKIGDDYLFAVNSKELKKELEKSSSLKIKGDPFGNIKVEKGKLQSIDFNVVLTHKDLEEDVKVKSEIILNWVKPQFEHANLISDHALWVTYNEKSIEEYLTSLELGEVNQLENFDEDLFEDLNNGEFYEQNNKYFVANSEKIRILNKDTFAIEQTFDVKNGELFTYNNKYYVVNSAEIKIYNMETVELEQTFELFDNDEKVHIYGDYAYQFSPKDYQFYKFNLKTGEKKYVPNSGADDNYTSYIYKDNYLFYATSFYASSGYKLSAYKLDLTAEYPQNIVLNIDGLAKLLCVTDDYELFYKEDGTLKKYNSSASFYNGVKVIEQDGFVYIFSSYNTQINGYYAYKYQGDTYIETIQTKYQNLNSNNTMVSPAEEKLYIDQEKTKYALKDSNVIYNADGSVFGTIPKVGLSSDYLIGLED